ncbi:MAG: hypothetical protein QXU32_02215 [Nitrososphaerales archaeon]
MASPGGRTKDGLKWIALNIRDFAPIEWHVVRSRATLWGIEVYPWARLAHPGRDSIAVLRQQLTNLVATAKSWGSRYILPNYEKEAETFSPEVVKKELDKLGWTGLVGWSTEGWLPNNVDYSPINKDPVLLQIFPEDMRLPHDPSVINKTMLDCVKHARIDKGFTYVGVTYQTYRISSKMFDLKGTHSLFTGDYVSANNEWPWWCPPYGDNYA